MMLAPPDTAAVGATEASFDPAIWKEDLIDVPVLGIYTEHSRFEDSDYAKKIFPKFSYVEVAGTGHFIMMERPEEFDRILSGFVDELRF